MLSQSPKGAGSLLSCQLLFTCQRPTPSVLLLRRDFFLRSQTTASDSSRPSHLPYRHKSSRRNRSRRPNNASRKIELEVTSLGKPGEVVVVPERKRRRQFPIASSQPNYNADKSALPFMLKDIEPDASLSDDSVVNERIESFRSPYQPHDKLTLTNWEDLRSRLQSSFTIRQLAEYISGNAYHNIESDTRIYPGQMNTAEWRPGVSMFLETGPASRESVADRVAVSQELKGKDLLAERILRDCWQFGVINEIGQLDIRLPTHSLSLLLGSDHFSFEELASLHEVKIDVTHSLGLVRVTGKQRSCESIREIIHDTTNRIRQEEIELFPQDGLVAKSLGRTFTPDFLSWVGEKYGIAFEYTSSNLPSRIYYLLENRLDAENARRTLNLAIGNAISPPVSFSTYMPALELAGVSLVDSEQHMSWPERQKSWFRWEMSSVQTTQPPGLDRSFFGRHQTRLSDELLKLLRAAPFTSAGRGTKFQVHESVTAAVGKCLFLRKPFFEEKQINASQLGKMSVQRTFAASVPRAPYFLRTLAPHFPEEGSRFHRIRLVPSALNANVFPQLELEIATSEIAGSRDGYAIRSAKAVLTESKVDYLLPEAALDIRFTRKVSHDLLAGSMEGFSLETLRNDIRDCFHRGMMSDSEVPLPAFTSVTLPNRILSQVGEGSSPSGSTTGEYMFLPINDIQGAQIHQYEFRDQQLCYASYESGPFNPEKTTDLFLQIDLPDESSADNSPATGSEHTKEAEPLQHEFNSFYNTACALAFELNSA